MEDLPLAQLLPALQTWLLGLALAMARPLAMVMIVPVFSSLAMTRLLRNGLVFALALPLVPYLALQSESADLLRPMLLLLLAKEVLLGAALGLALGLPFWAAQTAGDIVDYQRAAWAGTTFEPSSGVVASVTGTFLTLVLIAIFFTGEGARDLLTVLYGSYRIWPAEELLPRWEGDAAEAALAILDGLLRLGLLLAGPVILLLLAVDFTLGMVGRFAPQLNVFVLSLSTKSAVFLVALTIYWAFLAGDLGRLLDWSHLLPGLQQGGSP